MEGLFRKRIKKTLYIERAYLKSQVSSLKHYTTWVKPYLIAAKKLGMANFLTESGMPTPNIVNIFNNMEIRLSLLGLKEIKPENLSPELANLQLDKKYYSCVEAEIKFRTLPRATQSQQGLVYIHAGRTDINMRAYSLTNKDLEEIKKLQEQEDLELIEDMVEVSIKEIQEDIDKYLKKEPEPEKKEKPKFELPFKGIFKGFKQAVTPLKYVMDIFKFKITADTSYYDKLMRENATRAAEKLCYVLYDVYKKAHGMMTW